MNISEADAQAYLSARGIAAAVVVESFLLQASDFIESHDFKGLPTNAESQSMAWPRSGVYYRSGKAVAATEVPSAIAYAQAWIANYIANGAADPNTVAERDVKREKVDVLEVEYSDQTTPGKKVISLYDMPAAMKLLEPFLSMGADNTKSGILHHA